MTAPMFNLDPAGHLRRLRLPDLVPFGKWAGKPVHQMVREDPEYAVWAHGKLWVLSGRALKRARWFAAKRAPAYVGQGEEGDPDADPGCWAELFDGLPAD
jgi:hypothetical protein